MTGYTFGAFFMWQGTGCGEMFHTPKLGGGGGYSTYVVMETSYFARKMDTNNSVNSVDFRAVIPQIE